MSNLKEQLEVDMARFLENIETQDKNDQIETLRNLFDKYIHLSSCDFIMSYRDLQSIISAGKNKYSNDTFPVQIGSNEVFPTDLPNLCIIESTILFLNKNDCLKKLPKFNKKKG